MQTYTGNWKKCTTLNEQKVKIFTSVSRVLNLFTYILSFIEIVETNNRVVTEHICNTYLLRVYLLSKRPRVRNAVNA